MAARKRTRSPKQRSRFTRFPEVRGKIVSEVEVDPDANTILMLFEDQTACEAVWRLRPAGYERYSPGRITEVISKVRDGRPDPAHICTSHIERQNLTLRMQMRRLTRLTNAFSKKLDNLKAALALHFAYYNFCRIHKTLRITPAMEAGIADHIWTLAELLS